MTGPNKAGVKRPTPFDKRRGSVHGDVVRIVTERFAHLAQTEDSGVLGVCGPGGHSDSRARGGGPRQRRGGTPTWRSKGSSTTPQAADFDHEQYTDPWMVPAAVLAVVCQYGGPLCGERLTTKTEKQAGAQRYTLETGAGNPGGCKRPYKELAKFGDSAAPPASASPDHFGSSRGHPSWLRFLIPQTRSCAETMPPRPTETHPGTTRTNPRPITLMLGERQVDRR